MKILFFILACSALFGEVSYSCIDGYYHEPVEKKLQFMQRFLPYNPKIVGLGCSREAKQACKKHWPHCVFFWEDPLEPHKGMRADLVWLDSDGAELYFLEQSEELLKSAKVVYTKTHFYHQGAYYLKLKQYLESLGYSLFSHWYNPDKSGEAIFVKTVLFESSLLTLSYPAGQPYPVTPSPPLEIERFLKPVENKSTFHSMEGIDFIYMINLDERPEKFAGTLTELRPFGIYPYRFPAVNGWKLDVATINQLGVVFSPEMLREVLMGTTYKEAGGRPWMNNECLEANGKVYFILGMSPGAIGCVLSHLSILHDAYQSGYETIWIMEDDIEVVGDPNILSELIWKLDREVGVWDVLFTDIDTKNSIGQHVSCRAVGSRPNFNGLSLHALCQKFYSVSRDFSRIGMRYGSYSMIVRRSGMKKILDYFRTYRLYLPYDFDLWMVPDIQLYCVNTDIVSHRAGAPSDNSEPTYAGEK